MPSHATVWMLAAGSALASAALTYTVTRPSFQPAVRRVLSTAGAVRRPLQAMFSRGSAVSATSRPCAQATNSAPMPNGAFEEYRQQTLRQLQDEERAFRDFLFRLRMSRDRAEFDQFMSERRDGVRPGADSQQPAG